MRAAAATVVDIAAYLGVTPARVRQIIAEHGIKPTGWRWKAKLYDPRAVIAAKSARTRRNAEADR